MAPYYTGIAHQAALGNIPSGAIQISFSKKCNNFAELGLLNSDGAVVSGATIGGDSSGIGGIGAIGGGSGVGHSAPTPPPQTGSVYTVQLSTGGGIGLRVFTTNAGRHTVTELAVGDRILLASAVFLLEI
jgi:hypothetical protein